MTTNTITIDDNTVELIEDPDGWHANHGDELIHVTRVTSSSAVTPAKARFV